MSDRERHVFDMRFRRAVNAYDRFEQALGRIAECWDDDEYPEDWGVMVQQVMAHIRTAKMLLTRAMSDAQPIVRDSSVEQDESGQDYARVTVESGGVGSAWANVTDLDGAPLTVSCDSTWLTAYDLTYHGNAQQGGTVSDMPDPETLYYAPRTEVDLEGTPTHSDVNDVPVVFLGIFKSGTYLIQIGRDIVAADRFFQVVIAFFNRGHRHLSPFSSLPNIRRSRAM